MQIELGMFMEEYLQMAQGYEKGLSTEKAIQNLDEKINDLPPEIHFPQFSFYILCGVALSKPQTLCPQIIYKLDNVRV